MSFNCFLGREAEGLLYVYYMWLMHESAVLSRYPH